MTPEEKIIEALEHVKKRNIKLVSKAMFNWCEPYVDKFGRIRYKNSKVPTECDIVGAILLYLNKEHLGGPGGFKPWVKEVSDYLEKDTVWIWKLMKGWEGYRLTITTTSKEYNIPEETKKDPISLLGYKLSKKYL